MTTDLTRLALSVRQPWAWAIIHGGKDIENRFWRPSNPARKVRGRVAIHAAVGMKRDEYAAAADFIRRIAGHCPAPHELVRGAIVGTVEIVDVVTESASPWFFGPAGLVLRNPKRLHDIPARGQLGFFPWQPLAGGTIAAPDKWMLPKIAARDLAPAPADLFDEARR